MTSSERKIINCLWETKEKTPVRLVAQKANVSRDYARLLCRSLARSGHIKFENDLAHLLKKGRSRFESNDPVADEPMAVAANVTLLTDEPAVVLPASDRSDEEENKEEGAREDKDKDKPASSDGEFDRALADLELASQKDESEEKDKPEESKEEKTEEIAEEPKEEINTDKKEDALNKEVLAEIEATEEEKMKKPDETELKPESKAEEEKPVVAETVVGKEKELTKEAKAENPEKVALKEEPDKPSGSFGASFKKFVNWFAEKK